MKPDLDRPRRPNTDKLDPTRARPEPWFVGNGQGLMIAVLVICGVLVVVRIAVRRDKDIDGDFVRASRWYVEHYWMWSIRRSKVQYEIRHEAWEANE